ncbi:MAG: hypothetical protein HY079_11125 [Elusimicrobia bacterium]|nr:hypothetical protein [Elusimicrobiota bacterium]
MGSRLHGLQPRGRPGLAGLRPARLPGGLTFDTFGGYAWRARDLNERYYNADGAYVGAQVSRGIFSAGAQYAWQRYPLLRQNADGAVLFGAWYARKDLAPWTGTPSWRDHRAVAVPFSAWGRVERDFNGIEGFGSQGWIEQGVDWLTLPGGIVLDTFGAFRWQVRSLNDQYYDVYGPAAGVHLARGPFDLDLEYAWRKYPHLSRSQSGPQLSLTWYLDWDLAKLRRR